MPWAHWSRHVGLSPPSRRSGNLARPRGRPSNRQRWDEQSAQIQRLRQLLSRRQHTEETWLLVDQLLSLVGELEDLSSPLRAVNYEGTGHSAENPVFPGVTLTDRAGDRSLHHAGSDATDLHRWFVRQLRWTITTTNRRLTRVREPDPRPPLPRRKMPESVKSIAVNEHADN